MSITLGVNMITRKMTLFFSSILWVLSVSILYLWISGTLKFNSNCIMFWSVKYTFTCQRWHFQACYNRFTFSTSNLLFFWHMTCFVPNLILTPIWKFHRLQVWYLFSFDDSKTIARLAMWLSGYFFSKQNHLAVSFNEIFVFLLFMT